jgi:hypothetical protein
VRFSAPIATVRLGPNVYARYSFRDSILEHNEERHRPIPSAHRGHRDRPTANTLAMFSPENVDESDHEVLCAQAPFPDRARLASSASGCRSIPG